MIQNKLTIQVDKVVTGETDTGWDTTTTYFYNVYRVVRQWSVLFIPIYSDTLFTSFNIEDCNKFLKELK